MERIFWVVCPECGSRFYCNYGELRHARVKLMCPSCHSRFLPDDAAALDERVEEAPAAASRTP